MAQFCYLRRCKGAKHFCRLLLYGWQGWTWSRGLKLEKVGLIIQLFMSSGIEWSRICGTARLGFYNLRLRLRCKISQKQDFENHKHFRDFEIGPVTVFPDEILV